MKYRSIMLALVACAVFVATAHAHGVRVFAKINDGQIVIRSQYSGSGSVAVQGGKVLAKAPDGRIIFEGKTDGKGFCVFAPAERIDLAITVNAGNGHVSKSFKILADELTMFDESVVLPATEATSESVQKTSPTTKATSKSPAKNLSSEGRTQFGDIEDDDIRLRDVLGGLGWIVGLTGIAMYFFGRRKKDETQDVSR